MALEHVHAFTNATSIYCDACGYVREAVRQEEEDAARMMDDGHPD